MIGLSLGMGSLAFAQPAPKPHMDLVRGLRANGMSDLALDYLNELKNSNPSPDIVIVLPLEYARTWLDLAASETDEAKRKDLIAKAEERLTVFIDSSKNHPLLPQANVELARLMSLKGKGIFLKAKKIEKEPKERLDLRNREMARARETLKKAADKYAATVSILEGQLKQIDKDPAPAVMQRRKELSQFLMKSMLDQGIVLFDIGDTYEETGASAAELEQRGAQFAAAKKVFEKLMYMDDKEPLCWQGRAWAAQCDFMAGEEENAKRAFADLMAKKNTVPAAAAGVRVARYFGIFRAFDKDARTERQRWERAEKEASDWLRDYPTYRNTHEGIGARYYQAFMKFTIAKEDLIYDKDGKRVTGFKNVEARNRFDDAQKLFRELSESESEFTEKAATMRSRILIATADADGHGDEPPVEKLGTFEICYLMAQVQIARLGQFRQAAEAPKNEPKATDPKKDPKKDPTPKKEEPKKEEAKKEPPSADAYAKEEMRRFTNAMHYLEYGLQKVTPKDSVRDVFNAQLFLVECYRKLKYYPQAAVLGEYVARNNLKMPRAALAAQIAIQAYNIAHVKPVGKDADPAPMPTADADHVRSAAEFLVSTWPTEASADEARHIIGFYLLRESREKDAEAKNYERQINAWNAYAGIRDSYPAVYGARNELAGLMYGLVRPNDGSEAKVINQRIADNLKKFGDGTDPKVGKMWPRTLQLLEELPPPDEECLRIDAIAYLNSRSTLALLHQLEGKWDKAVAAGEQIRKALPKFAALKVDGADLSDRQKEENKELNENYANTAKNIVMASARSKAYKQFNDEKNYAAVAETLNPWVAEIQKDFAKPVPMEITPTYKRLRDTQRAILILALQTAVQDQKVDRAAELVETLEKSGSTVEENQGMLRSLVANVRRQIDDLEAEKKTDDANKLKEGFTTLLDKIKAKGEKLPTSMKIFIAQGYTGVDAFDKASELLEEIRKAPAPANPAPLGPNATEKEQEAFTVAKAAFDAHGRTMRGVQLALARNYRQAKNYTGALKLYDEIIGPISPKEPVPKADKRGWAFGAVEVRREKAAMLEEIAAGPAPMAGKGVPTKNQLWANAVQEWVAMIRAFAPTLPPIPKDVDPKRERLDAKGVEEVIKKIQSDEDKDRAEAITRFSDMLKAIPNLNAKADAKFDSFLTLIKKMQSEMDAEAADAQKRMLALLKGFTNSDVTDLADSCLRGEARSIKNDEVKKRFDMAITEIKAEVDKNRVARSQEATTTANKRRLYFELYFEQKRCSALAYTDLGLNAVKGDQASFDAKFKQLAQEMLDVKTAVQKERVREAKGKDDAKAKDADPLEKRIDDFLNENKHLKAAVKSIRSGN